MDTQQKELVGAALFEVALVQQGFEVAQPRRDRGVDLIIYKDDPGAPFRALPLQLKVSTDRSFSLDRKYAHIDRLVLAYIWVLDSGTRFFLLDFSDAEKVLGDKALLTPSWTDQGSYRIPRMDVERLKPYEDRWAWLQNRLVEDIVT